jgi:hypothetical protein
MQMNVLTAPHFNCSTLNLTCQKLALLAKEERKRAQKNLAKRVDLDPPVDLKKHLEIVVNKEGSRSVSW